MAFPKCILRENAQVMPAGNRRNARGVGATIRERLGQPAAVAVHRVGDDDVAVEWGKKRVQQPAREAREGETAPNGETWDLATDLAVDAVCRPPEEITREIEVWLAERIDAPVDDYNGQA